MTVTAVGLSEGDGECRFNTFVKAIVIIVDCAGRERNCFQSARLEERSVRLCYLISRLKKTPAHGFFIF